jgi:hypothetical protein
MCFQWPFFVKRIIHRNFHKMFPCSCDVCGSNFNNLEELIVHMGCHQTDDINDRLIRGRGTVRCNKCWKSFTNVATLYDHPCVQSTSVIGGLSPISSSDSLQSVVIHHDWTYIQSYTYRSHWVNKIVTLKRSTIQVKIYPYTSDELLGLYRRSYIMLTYINELRNRCIDL